MAEDDSKQKQKKKVVPVPLPAAVALVPRPALVNTSPAVAGKAPLPATLPTAELPLPPMPGRGPPRRFRLEVPGHPGLGLDVVGTDAESAFAAWAARHGVTGSDVPVTITEL